MRNFSLVAMVLAVGCGGTLSDDFADPQCAPDRPPAQPVIATPFAGLQHVIDEEVIVSASDYVDADGDPSGGAEVELWAVSPTHVLTARLWSATFAAMPATVRLADGTFDFGLEGLQPDTKYAVKVRYKDSRPPVGAMECSSWSAWSDPREFHTDDGSRGFFDDRRVQEISIEIPPDSWAPINNQSRPPGCVPFDRSDYNGAITVGGVRYDGVGVTTKGGCGSSRDLGHKASFKVSFAWDNPAVPGCPAAVKPFGQRSITMNNGVQDRSAAHERLAYEFYHAMGVAAPRSASLRVNVNGAYWGVYQLIESVDRPMLGRWFKSAGGMLYEGTYWCDLVATNLPVGDVDNKCLGRKFHPNACEGTPKEGDDPQTYGPLRDFIARLDALPAGHFMRDAPAFLALDDFLSLWAADSVLDNWDDYALNIVNNYRVYHDTGTGLWHVIPTGVDQTMAGDSVDPFNPNGRLAKMCLQDPDCKAAFAARLREAAATFESMDLVDRAKAIHDQIMGDVLADPRKEYDMGGWESANANLRTWITNRPQRIRQRLAAAGFP